MKKSKPKLVLIEWEDSYGGNGRWTDIDEMEPEPLTIISVGYLIHDLEHSKVVVPHLTNKEHPTALYAGQGQMTIPTRCIRRVQELQPK